MRVHLNCALPLLFTYAVSINAYLSTRNNILHNIVPLVKINKCCEPDELYISKWCTKVNGTGESLWKPIFTNEHGGTVDVKYELVPGLPDCPMHEMWPIYHYADSLDVLRLLPDGALRHYEAHGSSQSVFDEGKKLVGLKDYLQGKYCLDKRVEDGKTFQYALICHEPGKDRDWATTKFLMRNVINPITHLISIACFLTVAIIYFVMPTLKDLVGNIVTTMCLCMIVGQAADLIRLLTIFTGHLSLFITEALCYISLLGAFFWLNSLAFYIWKTFKSRNVYLRITDSKKFCYYSTYAWSCTFILGTLAIFAHYTLDYDVTPTVRDDQEHVGSLGIIIFFMPVAFTILIDVFFFATTMRVLGRMNTYGRIHHKLKHSFRMFLLLFLIMTLTWIFFLMSLSKFEALVYGYIIINALQAPIVLYICLFNQKHVAYLLRKTCCYKNCVCSCCRPDPEIEWGDEMTAMNNGIY